MLTSLLAGALLAPSAQLPARNIAYGSHPLQKLDVFPSKSPRSPILVMIHGGGWTRGSKEAMAPAARNFAAHGVTVVAGGYRLAPDVKSPALQEDVASVVAWAKREGASHNGDPNRIFLFGHSAGAHLAALVGSDPRYLATHSMTPKDLRGVIPVDTASFDLLSGGPRARQMASAVFGGDDQSLRAASPLTYAGAGPQLPAFFIPYVASRVEGSAKASEAFAEAIRKAGGRARTHSAEGKTHATIMRGQAEANDPVFRLILEFVIQWPPDAGS